MAAYRPLVLLVLAGSSLLGVSLAAQDAPMDGQSVASASPVSTAGIPAMTELDIEVAEPLNSKTAKIDQFFPIRLAAPLVVDGQTILPAGLKGEGQVIHAAKPGLSGRAGELLVAARYLDCGGQRIALRSFRLGARGTENVGASLAVAQVVGPLALFVGGKNTEIPAGARATAKLANAFELPAGGCDGGQQGVAAMVADPPIDPPSAAKPTPEQTIAPQ